MSRTARALIIACSVLLETTCGLVFASEARSAETVPAKPVLFYQRQDAKHPESADAEGEDRVAQTMLHDRLVPLLESLLHTQIVSVDLGTPTAAQVGDACRSHGAIGVIAVETAYPADSSTGSEAGVQVSVEDCSGTEWFIVDGASNVDTSSGANLRRTMKEVVGRAAANLKQAIDDTPRAASNFVRYGMYMNDSESDSLWTLAIENGKATVDTCDPIGTAFRAGLRAGDEVVSINGNPTDGLDQGDLDAILANTKHTGPWTLELMSSSGASRTVTFQDEPVRWYIAHPAP